MYLGDMEGTGDSYSEIMQRLQSSLAASSLPKSNSSSLAHLSISPTASHSLSNSQATLSQSQSLFQSQSHTLSQSPSSFTKPSSFMHSQSKPQHPQALPSRSSSQPLSQTNTPSNPPTHSRSLSQPSLRPQLHPTQTAPAQGHSQHNGPSQSQTTVSPGHGLSHSPRFQGSSQVSASHPRPLSQPSSMTSNQSSSSLSPPSIPHLPPAGTLSHSLFTSFGSLTPSYPIKKEPSPSLSDSSLRTALSVDVTMEESSPGPPTVNGPSNSSSLSPSLNPFHSMSQRYSTDLSQMSDNPPRRRGHRRAQSEIAFGRGSSFDRDMRLDRELERELEMDREALVDLDEDMDRGTWGKEKSEADWDRPRERQKEREGEKGDGEEGAEDLFSMYIDMEKINSYSNNSGAVDGGETEREKSVSRDIDKERFKNGVGAERKTSANGDDNQRESGQGPGDAAKEGARESWAKTSAETDKGEGKSPTGKEKDQGETCLGDEMRSRGHDREKADLEMARGVDRESWGRREMESEKESGSMCVDNEGGKDRSDSERGRGKSERPFGGPHHSRSVSMDGFLSNLQGYKVGEGSHLSSLSEGRRSRHHHSNSMDGSVSLKMEFGGAEFEGIELKKAMASDKLADLALVDPKRAKRILANRQSAARSKERKMRYISELERKVQTLQTEATTLSAQLTMLQRDSTGLTTENSELKLRLQAMEQQAQLRDALNDALREEVQRLKLATGQLAANGQGMSLGQQIGVNPQLYQLQQQLQQQAQATQQHQSSHSDFLQRSAFGALQGLAGSLGGAFLKSEGSSIAVNQGSSSTF